MVPQTRRSAVVAALVIVNAVPIILLANHFLHKEPSFDETTLPYHLAVPISLAAVTPLGQAETYFLAFVGTDSDRLRPRLRFLESMAQRYGNSAVKIAVVTESSRPTEADFRKQFDVPTLPVVHDVSADIQRELHIGANHRHGGIAVVSKSGTLEFRAASLLNDDQIRQLIEKYATGTVNYSAIDDTVSSQFVIGSTLPMWPVVSAASGASSTLKDVAGRRSTATVVLTAECATCQLTELGVAVNGLAASLKASNRAVLLLVNDSIPLATLQAHIKNHSLPAETYIVSKQYLFRDSTVTRVARYVPLVAYTTPEGRITATTALR
jgi:hypothetical protein